MDNRSNLASEQHLARARIALDVASVFVHCAENRHNRNNIMSLARAEESCSEAAEELARVAEEDEAAQPLRRRLETIEAGIRALLATT